ncbi:MAG TPA: carbohydrate ABC transporter substrate-binding protein [Acholeplasma sp.]|nr:carbohydrate ABC transporter substrate-binding protein [Acholeplasma sp.]
MKKIIALLMIVVLSITLIACGENTGTTTTTEEGKILNIRVWNTEFIDRFRTYYPGYLETKSNGDDLLDDGTIVKWIEVANDNNGYQNALDAALLNQSNAKNNDKTDIFLIEADYAKKYANDKYALDVVKDLNIPAYSLNQQYQYTKDIVTDDSGSIRGVSWQATPGLYAFRADIAEEVLGTSDPVEIQAQLNTWAKFDVAAAKMAAKGYYMLSGFDDAYRTFSNNTSAPWVDKDGKVVIDEQIINWIKQTKNYADKDYNHGTKLWDGEWSKDQGPQGNVFGFFYSTWGINFTLLGNSLADPNGAKELGNGLYGQWRVVEGPASYYWGGTWIVGAKGTDNPSLVRDIMLKMTANENIMKNITLDVEDYTNNEAAMNALANDPNYGSSFLGGQNHVALFGKAAANIDMSNISAYDQGLNEAVQTAFRDFFLGDSTWAEAWAAFESLASTKYPELTYGSAPANPFN